METVDLGSVRLRLVVARPGLPGEAERVAREVASTDAAVVLADLDTDECLRLLEAMGRSKRPWALSYVDGLFQEEMASRFGAGSRVGEHPMLAAAREARKLRASFIPLRPVSKDPGFLARRRGRRVVRALPRDVGLDLFPDAFATELVRHKVWSAGADAEAAQPRLARAVAEGRAPVVAVVQAHRATPFVRALFAPGRVVA